MGFLTQGVKLVIRSEIFDPRFNVVDSLCEVYEARCYVFDSFCETFDFRYDIETRVGFLTQGIKLVILSDIFDPSLMFLTRSMSFMTPDVMFLIRSLKF